MTSIFRKLTLAMEGNVSKTRTYHVLDLVRAYLDARRWRSAHPELAGYHLERYSALASAFAVNLDSYAGGALRVADADDDSDLRQAPDTKAIASIFTEAVRQYQCTASPLDALVEAPEPSPLIQLHVPRLTKLAEATREALISFMGDLLVALAPHVSDMRPSSRDLRALGFDDSRERPEPLDYL